MKLKKWQLKDTYLTIKHNLYKNPPKEEKHYSIVTFCPRGTVVIVALTKKSELMLLKEYRPAIKKEILNLPGGRIDKGESAEKAARREFEEEVSFKGEDFKKIGVVFPNPTRITDKCTIFFVRNVRKLKRNKNKIIFLKLASALKLIKQGKLKCMISIAAILLAKEKGFIR